MLKVWHEFHEVTQKARFLHKMENILAWGQKLALLLSVTSIQLPVSREENYDTGTTCRIKTNMIATTGLFSGFVTEVITRWRDPSPSVITIPVRYVCRVQCPERTETCSTSTFRSLPEYVLAVCRISFPFPTSLDSIKLFFTSLTCVFDHKAAPRKLLKQRGTGSCHLNTAVPFDKL